jgi:hypothetical protein
VLQINATVIPSLAVLAAVRDLLFASERTALPAERVFVEASS